jgi:hypothetical protein
MLSRILVMALVGTLFLVTSCDHADPASPSTDKPVLAQAPATGNGNKFVTPVNEELPFDCDGEQLTANITGWVQGRLFPQPSNPNVALDVFHQLWTFTNSAGETFKYHDVGPNRVHFDFDTGELILELTGRIAGAGIGHLRINLDTGETEFIGGKESDFVALACEALT